MQGAHNPVPDLALPPGFAARWVAGGAFDAARAAADEGVGAAALFLAEGPELLEIAVVLEPDRPLVAAWPAVPVAMLAAADALAALGPPMKAVRFAWPNLLVVDGGRVGRMRGAAPDGARLDDLPAWLVVGLDLRMRFADDAPEPGHDAGRTALCEEGFGDVAPARVVETFARHFLHWIDRWQEEGLAPAIARYRTWLVEPRPEIVRFDPQTFDLVRIRPPAMRHALADALDAAAGGF